MDDEVHDEWTHRYVVVFAHNGRRELCGTQGRTIIFDTPEAAIRLKDTMNEELNRHTDKNGRPMVEGAYVVLPAGTFAAELMQEAIENE